MVACGLEMCKGVLSFLSCMKAAKKLHLITCSLVSNTKQHDFVNASFLLADTSNDRCNVCFTSQSTEKYYLETQGQVQH